MPKKHKRVKTAGLHALASVRKFFPEVDHVRDADKNLIIEVTERDGAISKKGNHEECAMAVACKRKLKLDGVIMSRSSAYTIKNGIATRFKVPVTVSREITSFDRGAGFDPGVYMLSKPTPSYRLDVQATHDYALNKKNKKPSPFRHYTNKIRAVIGGRHSE